MSEAFNNGLLVDDVLGLFRIIRLDINFGIWVSSHKVNDLVIFSHEESTTVRSCDGGLVFVEVIPLQEKLSSSSG